MGHYASEMTDRIDPELAEIDAWQKANFTRVNSVTFNQKAVECQLCGSIMLNWRRHVEFCPHRQALGLDSTKSQR